MTSIALDISRLIGRSHFPTPTGIDRFELSYARWNLDRYGHNAIFLETGRAGSIPVSNAHALDLINRTEQRWSNATLSHAQTAQYDAVVAAIEGFVPWRPCRTMTSPTADGVTTFRKALSTLKGITRPLLSSPPPEVALIHVSHKWLDRPSAFNWLTNRPRTGVFYVHDLIPLSHPEFVRVTEPARHLLRMETVLRHARVVLCNSQTTALALDQLAANRGLPQPCTAIIPPGVDNIFKRLPIDAAAKTTHPYFVCVGTIEPRKNHALLLNLWRRLVERYGADAPRLVIVGRRGWDNADLFKLLNRPETFQGTVIEVSDLVDGALARLIAGATALLAPSFVEGYGMPVAEALALGTPVIASNIRSHREIAGRLAVLLDPLNGPGWLAALEAYASMPARVSSARRVCWSWTDHFRTLDRLLIIENGATPSRRSSVDKVPSAVLS